MTVYRFQFTYLLWIFLGYETCFSFTQWAAVKINREFRIDPPQRLVPSTSSNSMRTYQGISAYEVVSKLVSKLKVSTNNILILFLGNKHPYLSLL